MICFLKASSPLLFPQREVTDWHKEEERHGAGPRAGWDRAPPQTRRGLGSFPWLRWDDRELGGGVCKKKKGGEKRLTEGKAHQSHAHTLTRAHGPEQSVSDG